MGNFIARTAMREIESILRAFFIPDQDQKKNIGEQREGEMESFAGRQLVDDDEGGQLRMADRWNRRKF